MKKLNNTLPIILLLTTLAFAACKKTELPNTAPIANAGKDTAFNLTTAILLDGSASTDKENNIVHYQWKLVSGPSAVNIVRPDLVKTAVTNLVKGSYQFELTVTDQGGLSSTASINVLFKSYIKTTDTTIRLPYNRVGLKVESAGNGNYYQNSLQWKKISGPNSFTITSNLYNSTVVTNLVEGVYQFEMTVTYLNQVTEKDTTTITVLPDNNIYNSEKMFENLAWVDRDPISTITVNDISSFLTTGQQFKVYLKQDINADWQIVCSERSDPYNFYSYHYSIDSNVLKVFINYDPTGFGDSNFGIYLLQPAIKIVY